MHRHASIPSYTGQQMFYGVYVNSAEFGIKLTPEVGPNLATVIESVRSNIKPSPKDSVLIQNMYSSGDPARFALEQVHPFTTDQLIERMLEVPSWDYHAILTSSEPDDQVVLKAAIEVAKAQPLYILRYTLRNVMVFMFDPGWAHTRYNVNPFHRIGLEFPPNFGRQHGVWETTGLYPRSVREVNFDTWSHAPETARWLYSESTTYWHAWYRHLVNATSVLIVIGWIGMLLAFIGYWRPSSMLGRLTKTHIHEGFAPSVLAASMLFIFNAAVTGAFAEPDFRYHHFVLSLRVLIAGLGAAIIVRVVCQNAMLQRVC
jgi:hypothetical protein